jgi:hypothetical protein
MLAKYKYRIRMLLIFGGDFEAQLIFLGVASGLLGPQRKTIF